MAKSDREPQRASAESIWTLRLAGAQDDANPALWAPRVRAGMSGWQAPFWLLWRRRRVFLGIFLAVVGLGAALIFAIQPSYKAEARVSVQIEQHGQAKEAGALALMSEMAAMAAITSPELLREAAARFESGEAAEDTAKTLENDVHVSRAAPGLIAIQYANADPGQAALVVNTLAELYVAKREEELRAAQNQDAASAGFQVSVAQWATRPALPVDRDQAMLLWTCAVAALAAAGYAASAVDAKRVPVARVADIANATGAPVLMITEEAESHVS
jgi:uncharacterized protein involved in exopolysaccharide biosynthesis